MKRLHVLLPMLLLLCVLLPVSAQGNKAEISDEVVLTMGSWRTDDVEQMNRLLNAYKKLAPKVTIKFQPTNPPDYNATLRLQLDSGTGPDLMYARSYAAGQELYNAGYFADCTDIPGLMENFSASNLAPWQMSDGTMFAVPFAAVSHAVYYNKDIFKKEGLSIPENWEAFLSLCDTLEKKGYTPLANGLADEWDILETFFFGLLPNYIGGADMRVKYESGELPLNDRNFVEAYQAMADVAQYCPDGFESVTYNDSQVLFNSQKAVMFVDGSWTAGVYKDAPFDWGLFAIPAPKGKSTAICFHPDMAITMNTATKHPEEARAFLAWLCSEEGATTASQNLPSGYFPMIKFPIKLEDPHANEFLSLNAGRKTDARFVWPKLMNLYAPMNQAVIKVMKGDISAKQAADSVQALM
ncbi:ABC transporter substrate-binding protein [Sphaerochaeta halotolerans]|uniref:Probable sugar-binding periplasmic protein n=1 Tax=Sphaerochaeta halotolerans TaxID=2293840 RepID=A0A372MFG7_9SPIR|nr:extracellular solute-binding protein [Sphaerochaeta halotolerans]MBG0766281.1 extracellular solute-binding protein [Spirochaetaceae bacterium]MDK2860109.1 raffinose/stachyose/melibiose transport system substrate-binding protein [Sphaerochaeta sp.]MDN5333161.1 raffinose/stachyose/melibiose transport system substrate-binding protein [Sphaerochaeta sp.]MXI85837.1 extracellular solute-binding protein [Sphaerochaeta halotolerans]RFU94527.1 extracellular solute-binding protein [Sphaerochaeta halo